MKLTYKRTWLNDKAFASESSYMAGRKRGGEIVNEFLMSTGYLAGAHIESYPVFKRMLKARPAFLRK